MDKKEQRLSRRKKIRAKIFGTAKKPRLSVFRSNKYIYAQIINDEKGTTLASVSDKLKNAKLVGQRLAELAVEKKISTVVFDRSGFKYHGRVKALAQGAREKGLKF